jgi:hypothetical protein
MLGLLRLKLTSFVRRNVVLRSYGSRTPNFLFTHMSSERGCVRSHHALFQFSKVGSIAPTASCRMRWAEPQSSPEGEIAIADLALCKPQITRARAKDIPRIWLSRLACLCFCPILTGLKQPNKAARHTGLSSFQVAHASCYALR